MARSEPAKCNKWQAHWPTNMKRFAPSFADSCLWECDESHTCDPRLTLTFVVESCWCFYAQFDPGATNRTIAFLSNTSQRETLNTGLTFKRTPVKKLAACSLLHQRARLKAGGILPTRNAASLDPRYALNNFCHYRRYTINTSCFVLPERST